SVNGQAVCRPCVAPFALRGQRRLPLEYGPPPRGSDVTDSTRSDKMGWTDERVEQLKRLWAEGLSASQLAGRLGGLTRNAVLGKVHRLALSGRATPSRMKSHRARPRPPPGSVTKRPAATPRFGPIGNPALRALYQPDAETYVPPAEE